MTPASDAEIAARIGDERQIVLIAGDDVPTETGIGRRPATTGWEVYGPRMRAIEQTPPGPAHLAARRLQDAGRLRCVVTYGNDVFFEQAGVRHVIALRGSVELSLCTRCGYSEPLACLLELLPPTTRKAPPQRSFSYPSARCRVMGDTGLEPVTSALSRRRSPS